MLESEEFCQLLEDQYSSKLPFVVYRKPSSNGINALLQKDDAIYNVLDFNESGFVFAPFDKIEDAILLPYSSCIEISTSKFGLNYQSNTVTTPSKFNEATARENHIKLVKKGKDVIKTGVIKKIVLSRFEKVELKEYNTLALFGELLKSYKNAFVYCWFHPKVGLWLGATPESLLKVDGQKFETMSLAGTQLYQGSLDVKWNGKENEEQQIVTDFIVDSIKPLVHVIKISKVKTIRAGNILHLMTKISGTLITDLNSIENLLKALHPTPAICGLPVNSAKKFILKNEHYNRAFYTGYLGELNIKNKSDLYVNLRCMQIKGNESIIYVGGGITNDSIPESEWEETVNKSNTIKNVLLCS